MEAIAPPEEQVAFLLAMQAMYPQFTATFKRFSSRDFKRLSLIDAESLFIQLLSDATNADVLHLHLDWHSYLGHFPLHQGINMWVHMLTALREKPLLLFVNEAPSFLSNALMVLEKSAWKQLCGHFEHTAQHVIVVHDLRLQQAWLDVGFPKERLTFIPRPMPTDSKMAAHPAIQPALSHLVQRRLGIDSRRGITHHVLGFLPSDDDLQSTQSVMAALDTLPDVKLLVLGGSSETNPQYLWEKTLLDLISEKQVQDRVIITGPVHLQERYTYLNACDALMISTSNEPDVLHPWVHDCLRAATPVLLEQDSSMMHYIRIAYPEAVNDPLLYSLDYTDTLSMQIQQALLASKKTDESLPSDQPQLASAMTLHALIHRYVDIYEQLINPSIKTPPLHV